MTTVEHLTTTGAAPRCGGVLEDGLEPEPARRAARWRRLAREARWHRVARLVGQLLKVTATLAIVAAALVAYGLMDNRWYKVVAVEGNSMAPTFFAGDAVVITRPPDHVEVGMILLLEVDGELVTHRVVEVADDGTFATQGDANAHPDDYSDATVEIVGEVRFHLPELGRLIAKVQGGMPKASAWWVDADESPANTFRDEIAADHFDPGGRDLCSGDHAPGQVSECEMAR